MRVIYKYPLELREHQTIRMHEGYKILDVQAQDNQICMWCEIDSGAPLQSVPFWIFGTGKEMPRCHIGEHIATVQMGIFVWHLYEGDE